MNTVFIVRPFGNNRPIIKKEKDIPGIVFFNFDKVETDLIIPAMNATGLQGGTTQRIFQAGEIKEDMFSGLLLSDIVIADITVHNANVFYELGIRHALRKKTTILIKCEGYDDTPFDIIGYKYISYNKDEPSAVLQDLISFINESKNIERKDSPVFNILPQLDEQDTEKFFAVPSDFTDEVKVAASGKQLGKLSLLASEAGFFPWKLPALRVVGEALFQLKALEAGRYIWETIKAKNPNDIQANDRLATVYQRLAEIEMATNAPEGLALLAKSDLTIQLLLDNYSNLDPDKRAEAYALKGRNAKTKWLSAWKNSVAAQKGTDALQSINLETAYKNYEAGYYENLNNFYAGINALGLLVTRISLAQQYPDAWSSAFGSDEEAAQKLNELITKQQKLSASIELSLGAQKQRQDMQGTTDIWADITQADFTCITSARPARVATLYKQALENAPDFAIEAATNQLKIYEQLNVFLPNVQAALGAIRTRQEKTPQQKNRYLLFTGHMIDKPGRPSPRFPKEKEAAVRDKIKAAVTEEKNKTTQPLVGIGGGACGGDILFHEVCAELSIPTQMFLALPPDDYKTASVAFAGNAWIERFNKLCNLIPHPVLCDDKELPKWLKKKTDYTIWERNNLWELNSALVNGGDNMTMIALWDGKGGDGPGGTADMRDKANARGADVVLIDIKTI